MLIFFFFCVCEWEFVFPFPYFSTLSTAFFAVLWISIERGACLLTQTLFVGFAKKNLTHKLRRRSWVEQIAFNVLLIWFDSCVCVCVCFKSAANCLQICLECIPDLVLCLIWALRCRHLSIWANAGICILCSVLRGFQLRPPLAKKNPKTHLSHKLEWACDHFRPSGH